MDKYLLQAKIAFEAKQRAYERGLRLFHDESVQNLQKLLSLFKRRETPYMLGMVQAIQDLIKLAGRVSA